MVLAAYVVPAHGTGGLCGAGTWYWLFTAFRELVACWDTVKGLSKGTREPNDRFTVRVYRDHLTPTAIVFTR